MKSNQQLKITFPTVSEQLDYWNKKEEAELIRVELMYAHEADSERWFTQKYNDNAAGMGNGFELPGKDEIDDARDEAWLETIYEHEERHEVMRDE